CGPQVCGLTRKRSFVGSRAGQVLPDEETRPAAITSPDASLCNRQAEPGLLHFISLGPISLDVRHEIKESWVIEPVACLLQVGRIRSFDCCVAEIVDHSSTDESV